VTAAAPPLLEVDLGPGVRAAFTVAGFNLSTLVGDDARETVLARRQALGEWIGAPVVLARQVHGRGVHLCSSSDVDSPADGLPVLEADALVATSSEVAVAVLVADCVPVLLADPSSGLVAAVHAGRQGLVAGVVDAAVGALVERGVDVGGLRAVVGPAVCGACYEVPAALRDEVDAAVPGTGAVTSWGTPSLDLPAGVRSRLTALGVSHVSRVDACTMTDERWFSHRASQARQDRPAGRFAAVVRAAP
jgi:hypothetical protein